MTWYVTAWALNREHVDPPDPNAAVWTLSEDPDGEGWETDTGTDGYGLKRAKARELADAANAGSDIRAREHAAWCAGRDAAVAFAQEHLQFWLAKELCALSSPYAGSDAR